MERAEFIIDRFSDAGITINENQAAKFSTLFEFMVEYNKNVNLTSITEFKDVVMKHFIDSVLPFANMENVIPKGACFIDVGTGAGYPGIPLMIYRSDLKGTLCDSLQKRCVYLEKACEKISVKANIVHARSEELGRKMREKFDFSTARAVAAMPMLAEYCIPFVKQGGRFIALKSVNENLLIAENAIMTLGGETERITDYKLPNGDNRRVIVIKKAAVTPLKYPRASAKIQKNPL